MTHTGKLRNMASVYLLRETDILLLYRQGKSIVSNMWIGSAGGHFEQNELNDATTCVLREMQEELGLSAENITNLQLRYVTLRYADQEIRQNYYFFAHLNQDIPADLTSTEGICRWFPLSEISDLPMPYTARHMIDHYISCGQFDDHLYGGIATASGVHFEKL